VSGNLGFRIENILLSGQNLVLFLELFSDVADAADSVLQLLINLLSHQFVGLPCQTQEPLLVIAFQGQIFYQIFVHQIDELLPELKSKVCKLQVEKFVDLRLGEVLILELKCVRNLNQALHENPVLVKNLLQDSPRSFPHCLVVILQAFIEGVVLELCRLLLNRLDLLKGDRRRDLDIFWLRLLRILLRNSVVVQRGLLRINNRNLG